MYHNTNVKCRVFHQQIQQAAQQERIKFEKPDKSTKIDGHPLPASALGLNSQEVKGGTKLLVSGHTGKINAIGLEARVSA